MKGWDSGMSRRGVLPALATNPRQGGISHDCGGMQVQSHLKMWKGVF
jgi:hypothetical protein